MASKSKLKTKPVTKEITIQGIDNLIKKYFNKIKGLFSGPKNVAVKKASSAPKVTPKVPKRGKKKR